VRAGRLLAVGLAALVLGAEPATSSPVPDHPLLTEHSGLGWGDFYIDSPGNEHSRGRGVNGTGARQGHPEPRSVQVPESVELSAVSGGFNHALGLTRGGHVLAWGHGYRNVLGNGTAEDHLVPAPVSLPRDLRFTAVSAGLWHSLALDEAGRVWSWGFNRFGQLGDGTRTQRAKPVLVALPAGTRVTAIAAGSSHSVALTSSGSVFQWGRDAAGEDAGPIAVRPTRVPLPTGVQIVLIRAHGGSNAVAADGRVFVWGDARWPMPPPQPGSRAPYEPPLPADEHVVDAYRGVLLTRDGEVYETFFTPFRGFSWRQVPLPSKAHVVTLAPSHTHVLAVTQDRRLLAWGDNRGRQLGRRSRAAAEPKPGYVDGIGNVITASAGSGFSLVTTSRTRLAPLPLPHGAPGTSASLGPGAG
jgi:alpha-tubulin suppressor-like RCC1 family protein